MTTLATYVVEIDWSDDGDFGDTGEDVTGDTIRIRQMSLGRNFASPLTGKSIAGKLVLELRNDSDTYSPSNAGSPIAGNIKPGRKVRVRTSAPSAATLWTGFLDEVRPIIQPDRSKIARLTATGPLGRINDKKVRAAMQTSIGTGAAVGVILDEAGWPAGDRDIDTGQTTLSRWWVEEMRTITALREVEASESGFIREQPDGDIAFEDRHHRLTTPHTVSQATYTDNSPPGAGEILYTAIRQLDPNALIFNEFRAEVRKFSVGGLAVLWTHPETGADSPGINAGTTRTFWAGYPNPQSATNAVAVDAWTTPASTTDYTANAQAGGGGADMTSDISVAVTKFGGAMSIALTNNHASDIAYMTFLQARGTPVTADDPVIVSAEDTTSQSEHGERTYPRSQSARWVDDSDEAQDWANFNLGAYKDPSEIVQLAVNANRDSDHMTEVLTRQVSDRITLEANENSGLGIDEAMFVERVNHIIHPGRFHTMLVALSSASAFSGFWVLDISKFDTETKLAY